jgi:WD40 repeat protein
LNTDRVKSVVPYPYEPVLSGEDHINGNTWPNLPYAYDEAVSLLVRGDVTGLVRIWSVPSYELIHEWPAHERIITALTYSPDAKTLYTASVEGTAKAWRIEDESLLWTVSTDDREPVFSIGSSPDGLRVAIGFGEDSSINVGVNPSRIVDARSGETLVELGDAIRKRTLIAFTPDGEEVVSGAWGRPGTDEISVRFFDASNGEELPYAVRAIGLPYRMAAVPNSPYVLFLGSSREPLLWDLETDREVYRVQRYDVSQIAVHPGGGRFVGKSRGRAVVFAVEDGRPLLSLEDCVGLMTFSGDGNSLFTRTRNNLFQRLPAEDWTLTDEVKRKASGLESLRDLLNH